MATAVPSIRAELVIQEIPPHSRNWNRMSMSAVTRDTNAPRFSALCSAMLSSWMWAKALTLRFARAVSVARSQLGRGSKSAAHQLDGAFDPGLDLLGSRRLAGPRSLPAAGPSDLFHRRQLAATPLLPDPLQDPLEPSPAEHALQPRAFFLQFPQPSPLVPRTNALAILFRPTTGAIAFVEPHAAPRSYAETIAR